MIYMFHLGELRFYLYLKKNIIKKNLLDQRKILFIVDR